ncbi:SCO1 protein [Annulohypoxylon nitens]|nr:SCO1 protein [Annulohypoxylon nitens]
MSRSLVAPKPLLRSLLQGKPRTQVQAQAQQCRCFLSTKVTSPSLRRSTTQQCAANSRNSASTPSFLPRTAEQRRYKTFKTVEEAKSRYRTGPFSWKAGVLFVITGGLLAWYFESEKQRMQRVRIAEATKGVGKPKVGGEFELMDQEGRPFVSGDMRGKYSLIYFGFTHCPDICPDELDKMARMYDLVEEKAPGKILPIFVTCDPERDDPKTLKSYLTEFHPKFIGLTGTYEQIRDVCKAYRVYFSTPQNVKPGQDYLVDHSIYFYLMDPEGDFVEALGRQHSPEQAAKVILNHMSDWKWH